jgi:GH15 family glucan-1,4-alpha-glucosidase
MIKNDFVPIEDYFVIGDLRTAALVSAGGSIDWLCLPDFDCPSVLGKMLDPAAGCLAIDMPGYKVNAKYVEDAAIVEFKLSRAKSKAVIRDFMVPKPTKGMVSQQLVRSVSGMQDTTKVIFRFEPRPNYGLTAFSVQKNGNRLQGYQISVPVQAGENKQLVLEFVPKGKKSELPQTDLEAQTAKFWREWIKKGDFFDFCHGYLVRSAITLKLMQFYPTGAMVAAPTTSLPEEIGGVRNWDYRYAWIRDATFTLYAFYILGYQEEAESFFDFIEKVTEKCTDDKFDVSLMYTIHGDPVPKEAQLSNLAGYKDSAPVRVGNSAAEQFQLDVYGALIDAFYFASKHGLAKANKNKWRKLVTQLVRKIDELWQDPDSGIWEARDPEKHYTYSKVMAWVGADRAYRLKDPLGLDDKDIKICQKLEESIKQWVWQNCYKDDKLVQHPETSALDATNFLLVLLQFLDKHEPRTRKIIDDTAKELSYEKVFVYRYLNTDGLPGKEGAFVLCSFWLVSALAILEDVEAALSIFTQLEKYMKPHGLLSEEVDPKTKQYLGNYPQAFSHINKYAGRKNIKL